MREELKMWGHFPVELPPSTFVPEGKEKEVSQGENQSLAWDYAESLFTPALQFDELEELARPSGGPQRKLNKEQLSQGISFPFCLPIAQLILVDFQCGRIAHLLCLPNAFLARYMYGSSLGFWLKGEKTSCIPIAVFSPTTTTRNTLTYQRWTGYGNLVVDEYSYPPVWRGAPNVHDTRCSASRLHNI